MTVDEPSERGQGLRARLARARLMLLFTPRLCRREPLETLAAALPWVEAVQVRIEAPEAGGPAPAAEACRWAREVLRLVARSEHPRVLVLVNDRVDVAAHLADEGLAGVHLGADDCPPEVARRALPPELLIGLSTHGPRDLVRAEEVPVDYLGFGPVHPTTTKGHARGLGAEAAWVAANATPLPLFPIGGIDTTNVEELAPVGRAAVCSAVLGAEDPATAARTIREALEPSDATEAAHERWLGGSSGR